MRYLTGFTLAEGEEKVSGNSGRFLVGMDDLVDPRRQPLHDPGPPRGARGTARRGVQRPASPAGPTSWRRSAHGGSPSRPGSCRSRCGRVSPRRRPVSSSCLSKAGSRRTVRPRSRPRSNGSRRRARSPTGPWPRSCPRSSPASPRPTSRSASNGGSEPVARKRSPSMSRACRDPRPRCHMARPATGRSSPARSCCSTSVHRSPATEAT